MMNGHDRSISAPKRKRELVAWEVSFEPRDSEDFGFLVVTMSLKPEAASTPLEAVHEASAGLLPYFAEHLGTAGLGDAVDWRLVKVGKVLA